MNVQLFTDKLAISLSTVCVLHCLFMPSFLILSSWFAAFSTFLREFGLSNSEGIALMCLAEALLRVPDDATLDALIAEKISEGNWGAHESASETQIKDDNFEFELPWEDKIKFVSKDGKEIPEWIKYDPKLGKVIASPPENVKSIDLKVILEDSNGEISVKDIKLNFENNNTQESQKIIDNETKFVSLSSQLSKEYSNWDSYGSQLIDRL